MATSRSDTGSAAAAGLPAHTTGEGAQPRGCSRTRCTSTGSSTTTEAVTVDDSLQGGELRTLALRCRDVGANDLTFLTAPVRSSGWEGKQSVLYLDQAKCDNLFTALRKDRVAAYVDAGGRTNRVRAPN